MNGMFLKTWLRKLKKNVFENLSLLGLRLDDNGKNHNLDYITWYWSLLMIISVMIVLGNSLESMLPTSHGRSTKISQRWISRLVLLLLLPRWENNLLWGLLFCLYKLHHGFSCSHAWITAVESRPDPGLDWILVCSGNSSGTKMQHLPTRCMRHNNLLNYF